MEILQCSKHYPLTHETILNVIIIGNTSLEKMVGDGLIFGYVSRRVKNTMLTNLTLLTAFT